MKNVKFLPCGLAIQPKIVTSLLSALAILLAAVAPGRAQSGTWTLTGTGLWSDTNNWQSDTVANGAGNTATFTSSGATTVHLDSPRTIGNLTFSSGAGTYLIDNNGSASNILTLDAATPTISVAGSTTVTISAVIDGIAGLTKANTGASSSVLVLTGSNTYSGTTTISGGSVGFLQINSDAALGSSDVLINSQNGGLRFGAAFSYSHDTAFGISGGRIDTNGFDVTISSSLSGTINTGNNFTKVGAGTLTLAGNNTIGGTGGVNVSQGALKIDSDARLGAGSGALTLNGGAIIYAAAFNNLRNITLGTSDGTLDTNGLDVTYSGTLTGNAGQDLKKAGLGTLTLAGTQTYAGTTQVNAGTLLVNGTHTPGAVSVNASGTLGGTGTIGGNTTVLNNGILSPGDDTGTLTINANLTLNAGATYVFGGGDLVDVGGTLTLTNNWTLTLTSGLMDGGFITIFNYGALGASPDLAPTFDISQLGFTPSGTLSLADTGSSIVLNGVQAVVPEPSAVGLLVGGGVILLALARRNRRRQCVSPGS